MIKAGKDLDKYVARRDREVDKTSEDSPLIRQYLGLAYAARGQHRKAIEQFTAASHHQKIAEFRQRQDRWGEAIEHWQHVARLRALEPDGLLGLAAAQIHLQRFDDAQATIGKVNRTVWSARFSDVSNRVRDLQQEDSPIEILSVYRLILMCATGFTSALFRTGRARAPALVYPSCGIENPRLAPSAQKTQMAPFHRRATLLVVLFSGFFQPFGGGVGSGDEDL